MQHEAEWHYCPSRSGYANKAPKTTMQSDTTLLNTQQDDEENLCRLEITKKKKPTFHLPIVVNEINLALLIHMWSRVDDAWRYFNFRKNHVQLSYCACDKKDDDYAWPWYNNINNIDCRYTSECTNYILTTTLFVKTPIMNSGREEEPYNRRFAWIHIQENIFVYWNSWSI